MDFSQDLEDRIARNLAAVRARIAAACAASGRAAQSVNLVAVSKTQPVQAVAAAAAAGQIEFGENYAQEGLPKLAALAGRGLAWHFIGPVQSNKTRALAEGFDWVHGVERLKVAQRLAEQRPPGLPPLNVCLQVNISAEASKSGLQPAEVAALAHEVVRLPRLRLRGLMAIPAPAADPAQAREPFRRLRELYDVLRAQGLALDTLSMGMSEDLEAAIYEGSTLVRVGTAIFGARNPSQVTTG